MKSSGVFLAIIAAMAATQVTANPTTENVEISPIDFMYTTEDVEVSPMYTDGAGAHGQLQEPANTMTSQDVFEPGQTYLFIAQNNHYVSEVNENPLNIAAAKPSLDVYCLFRATVLGNGKVAFKARNGAGKYLTIVELGYSNVEASSHDIDDHCQFEVEVGEPIPGHKGERYVYFKGYNGKYWGRVNRFGYKTNIEAYFNTQHPNTRFRVLKMTCTIDPPMKR